MANKRVKTADYNPLFSCVNKQNLETEQAAVERAALMNKRQRGPASLRVHPYPCPNCGGWHVGHKKRPRISKKHDPRFRKMIRNR